MADMEEKVKLLLQSSLEEMRNQLFQETKEFLMKEYEKANEIADKEEAKTEENVNLQSALEEMRLQFQETKELLMKECKKAKENAEMVNKLTAENEQLKASEEAKTREIAKLQSCLLEEMRLQLQGTKALLSTERETTNQTAHQMPLVQEEVQVTDQQKLNYEPTAENELHKVHQPVEKIIADQVSAINETGDHEIISKLAAENLQLKALVSSLEKQKIEATKLSEERLKQVFEAESKMIELKIDMQRINGNLSDIETEVRILRQRAL